MKYLSSDDPLVIEAVAAIRSGDVQALRRLLAENPSLATARLESASASGGRATSQTLLHVVADWPGHFPNGPDVVAALASAGADVNARFEGTHAETPLHWAASSDDVAVLEALLDHGADLEAPGAVIGGGTPIADAAAFGQWQAAQRLAERGAETSLWIAAALGLLDRVRAHFDGAPLPPWTLRKSRPDGAQAGGAQPDDGAQPDEVTHAFWCACHGGQSQTAEFLLDRSAEINWIGYDGLTALGAARRAGAVALAAWLIQHGAKMTEELS